MSRAGFDSNYLGAFIGERNPTFLAGERQVDHVLVAERPRHFWANVRFGTEQEINWVQEWYYADIGQAVIQDFSAPVGKELEVLTSESYYKEVIGLG